MGRLPGFCYVLLTVAAATGAVLRLAHYLDRRPLWLDECMLALNIASRGFLQLLEPLDYNQAAPLLFLWAERIAIRLGGVNELALRALPLASGIVVIVAVGLLAGRVVSDSAAVVAAALAALSPTLIRYANEAKPYGTDSLVTVVLVGATIAVVGAPGRTRRWLVLTLAGALGILISVPGTFVAASAGVTLVAHRDTRVHSSRWIGMGATWLALLLILYFSLYRSAATNPTLHQGWERAFLRHGGLSGENLALAAKGTLLPTLFGDGAVIPSVPWPASWAIGVAAAIGAVVLARRHGAWMAVLLVGPLGAAVIASALARYPLGVPRMMVFWVPLLLILLSTAIDLAVQRLRAQVRPLLLAVAGLVAIVPACAARVADARKPWRGEDAVTLVQAYRERPRQEPIYVGARGIPAWLFYTTNWESPNWARLDFYARAASSGAALENLAPREHPVANEGQDLVYRQRDRVEILGIGAGSQWRWPDYVKLVPDEGWAQNEAARIAREANPCAWLFFTHVGDRSPRPLTWVLREDHRAKRLVERIVPGGVLFRYCFPYTPAQIEEMRRWAEHVSARRAKAARPARAE